MIVRKNEIREYPMIFPYRKISFIFLLLYDFKQFYVINQHAERFYSS